MQGLPPWTRYNPGDDAQHALPSELSGGSFHLKLRQDRPLLSARCLADLMSSGYAQCTDTNMIIS